MPGPATRSSPSRVIASSKQITGSSRGTAQSGRGGSVTGKEGLTFPAATTKLSMGTLLQFIQFQADFTGGKASIATQMTQAHIVLPLPENISETLGLTYDTTDLGVAMAGVQMGKDVRDKIMAAGEKGFDEQSLRSEKSDKQTTEYLVRSLAQLAPSVAGVINLASGNVPNPYTTAIFKNVNLRQHNLNFRLVPEDPEDSDAIVNIVHELKKHSLPTKIGHFLQMPDEVAIMFFGTNALFGFARCVIQNINVNYTPSNTPAFFKNGKTIGAPQAVELQLTLGEVEQLHRGSFPEPTKAGATKLPPPNPPA